MARQPRNKAAKPAKPTKVKAIIAVAVKPKPHGMSLAAKPERIPHPAIPGRDVAGRIMPGAALPGAAPPFTAQPPRMPPAPAVNSAGAGMGNMPSGPVSTGIPPSLPPRR